MSSKTESGRGIPKNLNLRASRESFLALLRVGSRKLRTVHAFVIFFGVNLWFAFSDRQGTHFQGVSVSATASQASKVWGWSDAGSYLQMGLSLTQTGGISEDLRWTLSFWPPGMATIMSIALKTVGLGGQFIVFLLALNCFLIAILFALVWRLIRRHLSSLFSFLGISLLYSTELVRVYLLRDSVIWSDGWAASFLSLSIVLAISSIGARHRILWIVGSGLTAGIAIYIRGQYFSMIELALWLNVFACGIYFLRKLLMFFTKRKTLSSTRVGALRQSLVGFAVWTFSLVVACAPYAVWRASTIGDIPWDTKGKLTWTSTESFAMMFNWIDPEDQAEFIREGGGGTACVINRRKCDEISKLESSQDSPFSIYDSTPVSASKYKKLTFRTLLSKPLEWAQYKFPIFLRYWFSEPTITTPGKSQPLTGLLALVGLAIGAVLPFARRKFFELALPISVLLVALAATFAPPFLAHFEVRYLVWPKFVGLLIASISLTHLITKSLTRNRETLG